MKQCRWFDLQTKVLIERLELLWQCEQWKAVNQKESISISEMAGIVIQMIWHLCKLKIRLVSWRLC